MMPEAKPGAAPEITYSNELITPEIAKEWLIKFNAKNRPIRRRHVETLARKMAKGEWRLNGEAIKFSPNGTLINGQHRLEAVILSKTAIQSAVARNVPDDAYVTLDQGAKRSAADDLSIAGVMNAHKTAAAARLIIVWNENLPVRGAQIGKEEIVGFLNEHPELAEMVSKVNVMGTPLAPSVVSAVGWMATRKPMLQTHWDTFLKKLSSGADLDADSPVLALRNTVFGLRKGSSVSSDAWFGACAMAWNDFVTDRKRRSFRLGNTQWPSEVIGYAIRRDPRKIATPYVFQGPTAGKGTIYEQ